MYFVTFFACVCVWRICLCVHVCVHMCTWRPETNTGHLPLLFSTPVSEPRDSLPPSSKYWNCRCAAPCLACTWVLGVQTQVLMLGKQVLYPLSHRTSPFITLNYIFIIFVRNLENCVFG